MYIFVGLGNPGREYEDTRHNIGFMAIDALSSRLGIAVKRSGFRSVYGEGRVGSERVILAKPQTYMNNSGWAVSDLLHWYKAEPARLVVIYDDIDLPCGAIRIRRNGSAGTHNGMRSIVGQLGHEDFPRIRIGIGRIAPELPSERDAKKTQDGDDGTQSGIIKEQGLIGHVLGVPSAEEMSYLKPALRRAAEAAELIICGEFDRAQEKINYKPPKKPKPPKPAREAVGAAADAEGSGKLPDAEKPEPGGQMPKPTGKFPEAVAESACSRAEKD